jgi:hypothetical protein
MIKQLKFKAMKNLSSYETNDQRIEALEQEIATLTEMLKGQKAVKELQEVHGFEYRGQKCAETCVDYTFTECAEEAISYDKEFEGKTHKDSKTWLKLAKIADKFIKDNQLWWM